MVSFTTIITAAVAATGALAAPVADASTDFAERSLSVLTARAGTPSSQGTHNGCFYSWWTDNGATATYTNGPRGNYQ